MATDFKLPELGEGIDGGDVVEILVAEGDMVDEGQTLLELETSKAAIPVPAPHAGRIAKVHVKPNQHVKVGQKLVTIEGSADSTPQEGNEEQVESATSDEKEVREEPSEQGMKHDPARERAESRSEKRIDAAPKKVTAPVEDESNSDREPKPSEADHVPAELLPAGPATRRLARELGVDLRNVPGRGPDGRILEEDVKEFVRQLSAGRDDRGSVRPVVSGSAPPAPLPDFNRWGPTAREPQGSVRRQTARQMSVAWSQIPHVTHYDDANITELERFRKRHGAYAESRGGKLTVTAMALKAVATALQKFPRFNASLDPETGDLILKKYYNVGVAVDTDRGLLVPVIRDAHRKGVLELAVELSAIAEKARLKKLAIEDLQGGTFTITNLGGIGGTGFSPIVNYPEVAILGLARSRLQYVPAEKEPGPPQSRLILPLCLSYDHRVIDGADAARFTRHVAELLEDPFLMLL